MSQPPDPYLRQYNFSNWSITHPGEPHQGAKLDLEFNELKDSLDQTQARLNEIQRDDGMIRPEKLSTSLTQIINESAASAATAVYATNLAQLSDKAAARANLQLDAYYVRLTENNLLVYSDPDYPPVFTVTNQVQAAQVIGGVTQQHFAPLPGSTYSSRAFRASVLFGTLKDYPTDWKDSMVPVPDVTPRVDNVSFALLYAGTGGNGQQPRPEIGWLFSGDYDRMANLPSASNPLVSLYQLVDAISTHQTSYNHAFLPTENQKLAMEAATGANATNRFALLSDLGGESSTGPWTYLTQDQVDAITAAGGTPSSSNGFILTSELTTALAGKADLYHYHSTSDVTGLDSALAGKAAATHTHSQSDVTGLVTALAGKAALSHTHTTSQVTGLDTALAGKASTTDDGLAKAWVSFDASTTTPTIKASKNVTSVAKDATGVYTITFTNAFADANYCWTGGGRNPGNNFGLIVSQSNTYKTQTTTTLQVTTRGDDGSLQDATWVNVVVYR